MPGLKIIDVTPHIGGSIDPADPPPGTVATPLRRRRHSLATGGETLHRRDPAFSHRFRATRRPSSCGGEPIRHVQLAHTSHPSVECPDDHEYYDDRFQPVQQFPVEVDFGFAWSFPCSGRFATPIDSRWLGTDSNERLPMVAPATVGLRPNGSDARVAEGRSQVPQETRGTTPLGA
jgi:hypothetical protein